MATVASGVFKQCTEFRWGLSVRASILLLFFAVVVSAFGPSSLFGREDPLPSPVSASGLTETCHHPTRSQPNIVLVYLDDVDCQLIDRDLEPRVETWFPNISRLSREGMRFSNCHVSIPLCGPSRASLLTGQYASHNGIRCNSPRALRSRGTTGGFLPFKKGGAFGDEQRTPHLENDLSTWMKQAGYTTMFVGKYLHDDFQPYKGENWHGMMPKSWDHFFLSTGGDYFNTFFVDNGIGVRADELSDQEYPSKYRTDIEHVKMKRLLEQHPAENGPFFLLLAPYASHGESMATRSFTETEMDKGMVAPAHKNLWPDIDQQITPDFDEKEISDKPKFIQNFHPIEGREFRAGRDEAYDMKEFLKMEFRRRVLATLSFDEMLGTLVATLKEKGQLENTIILLTSDNGYHLGQQRHIGKMLPYNRSTNVPLVVWGPGRIPATEESKSHLVSIVDIAPTILDMAGATLPEEIDGTSFVPLVDGTFKDEPALWNKRGVLVENWEKYPRDGYEVAGTYQHLRLYREAYTEWATGEFEYYDLNADPWQLENAYPRLSREKRQELKNQLTDLKPKMPAPEVFIDSPFSSNVIVFKEIKLSGLAEFSGKIREVQLQICDVTESGKPRFWTGTEWSATRQRVNAELDCKGGLLTNWSYQFSPVPVEQNRRRFRVSAIPIGVDGKKGTARWKDFGIRNQYPITHFDQPIGDQPYWSGEKIVISGETFDENPPAAVYLRIKNLNTNQFWNGVQWQDEATTVRANSSVHSMELTKWEYALFSPKCSAKIRIFAIASAGPRQLDKDPPTVDFEVY